MVAPIDSTLDEMMRDVEPLERFVERLRLTRAQKLKIRALRTAARAYQVAAPLMPGYRSRRAQRQADLAGLTGLSLASRHPDPSSLQGGHCLSAAEIAAFERDGVTEPFDVMSPGEARKLAAQVERWHETEFSQTGILSPEVEQTFRDAGSWHVGFSGLFQAHRKQALFDVIAAPEVAGRLASLLGEDVLCWRSQLFPKEPGAAGTFWHQNSVFRETSSQDKLRVPPSCPLGMAQLTAWVALRDVTIPNGALRILPGSFADARLEYMYSFAQDHLLDFLAEVPADQLDTVLKAGLFSSGSFQRSQALFDSTLPWLRHTLEDREVRDITMRAGQAVIFTSLNMHASHPNTTDQTRLALVGRYTAGDVHVSSGLNHVPTPGGPMPYSMARVPPLLVHGDPTRCANKTVLRAPYPEEAILRAPTT